MCISTAVNLAVGMPEVYAGQEVGRGYGISDYDSRRRGGINWGAYAGHLLMPHYQKLAQIRKQFACFTTQQMVKVGASSSSIYAYTRPAQGLNGVVIANLDPLNPKGKRMIMKTAGNAKQLRGRGRDPATA